MTDDANTFWNGFKRAFPSSWAQKLCLWHMEQAMKRNAKKEQKMYISDDLLEPFLIKVREICHARDKDTFVAKYTSLLKYLRVDVKKKQAHTWKRRGATEWSSGVPSDDQAPV
ncbi:hypothetical protein ANCDUO_18524 [Ancylostoma duodenale]|uniref:MULE transposase domain-containing protein n=1 Tax=Ancylostoma duodenale TaxID=51022 RepID=A0A0C2G2X7_9BILA|nr:hypothetical protein ANCDUO_18524 [Ancylostoma duodenale]